MDTEPLHVQGMHVSKRIHILYGSGVWRPLHMPLVDSDVDTIVLRFSGTILAPDESSKSCTF